MKCLTLAQPWAQLVCLGAKKIETRSWRTDYRGPLAIHAAKTFPEWCRELIATEPFASALFGASRLPGKPTMFEALRFALDLPLGAVVATCRLVGCCPITRNAQWQTIVDGQRITLPEREFGDYEPGRYGWLLADVRPLPEPIPARGALGLWDWEHA